MRPEVEHKGAKVYIYTRVSTAMQVDGFSLDAQKDEILKEVRRHDMVVAGEYSDEGKSGKSISGREDFQRMLDDIVARKDDIRFVIVYKLSRFGRNTADILNTLKTMKFYGVHLICAADNIDSSMDSGKLMISILGAVAEIERENILAQTMAGRKEKARQGLFNGGITPFGYKSVEGKLEVVDAEAEVVRLIFDKYTKTEMGFPSIAKWLNDQGYEKGYRCKNSSNFFNERNVKQIIDNPVYTGRMAYGRTVTKAKENDPESSHRVKATEYILAEGQHEAIIDMETWEAACRKRKETGGRKDKIEKEHEYILSGLVKCPECGRSMYGVPMRGRKRKDGTMYPVYYSYMCRKSIEDRALGHKCSFGQVGCGKIDGEVRDVIMKLVNGENFGSVMSELVGESIDTQELERMMDQAYKDIRQAKGLQRKLEAELDALDVMDKHYERRYESCNRRLEAAFDSLDEAEQRLADAEAKMESVQRQGLTRDSVYEVLKLFGDIYDKMTDYEKKVFMQSFVESVELYPKEGRKRGTSVKTVHFHFPVSYKGESVYEISPPKGQTVETVVLLSKGEVDSKKIRVEFSLEDMDMSEFQDGATYPQIKEYVLEHTGLKVSNLYISQIKRKCGIEVGKNYNLPKSEDSRQPQCPPEKEKAIREAFKYFGMI